MPTLEPCVAGFTISGRPEPFQRQRAIADGAQHHGVGGHHAHAPRQALGAQLVHAERRTQHAAAGVGQAEQLERALHAAVLAARSVQRDEGAIEALRCAARPAARRADPRHAHRCRGACSAASTAAPDISEISRSVDAPPNSTATLPNSPRVGDAPHARLRSCESFIRRPLRRSGTSGVSRAAMLALPLPAAPADQLSRCRARWPRPRSG